MTTKPLHLAAAAALVALGCAMPAIQTERRPDGVYHLKCRTALPACLAQAELVCNRERYFVLRAFDDHNLKGDMTRPTDFRSSEALVRCGTDAASWGAETKALREQGPDAAPVASPAAPPPPARACVPGATQTCVGPGGCAGGQACAPDGATFGACDCGTLAAPPPPPAAP